MEEYNLKFNVSWDRFCETYKDNEYFLSLQPYDRLSCFVDYILELEKKN